MTQLTGIQQFTHWGPPSAVTSGIIDAIDSSSTTIESLGAGFNTWGAIESTSPSVVLVESELILVSGSTALASSRTCVRGAFGSTAVLHAADTPWYHVVQPNEHNNQWTAINTLDDAISKATTTVALDNQSGVVTVDLSLGDVFLVEVTGNVTALNFTNEPAAGTNQNFEIHFDNTGTFTVAHGASVGNWIGYAAEPTIAPNALTVYGYSATGASVVGYAPVRVSVPTEKTGTTYTAVASDAGAVFYFTDAAAVTVTIPSGLPSGFKQDYYPAGAGGLTVVLGSGVTSVGSPVLTALTDKAISVACTEVADKVMVVGGTA